MKPLVIGKSIFLREVMEDDASFIFSLRTNPELSIHLSPTTGDSENQKSYIKKYKKSLTDFYFIICDINGRKLGTVRIYDIKGDSFCWGSWLVVEDAPRNTAIESALLIYDFGFYALHFAKAHFDVRLANTRVVEFHKRFGASETSRDELNIYMEFHKADYLAVREKYSRFLP